MAANDGRTGHEDDWSHAEPLASRWMASEQTQVSREILSEVAAFRRLGQRGLLVISNLLEDGGFICMVGEGGEARRDMARDGHTYMYDG